MWTFYLKKSFCDGWDNMFSMVFVNAIFLIPVAGLLALMVTAVLSMNAVLFFAFLLLWTMLVSIQSIAFAPCAVKAADFRGWSVKDCLKNIVHSLKDGALFGLMLTAIILVSKVCLQYYFSRGTFLAMAVGLLFVWLCLFVLLSLQWFVPVTALLPGPFVKRVKKCFIIFFDNTGFSIFLAVYCIVLFALSVLLFGLLPAASGITLARVNALRLRLYKYDYLEAHPEYTSHKERKIIPWQSLIEADREALGPRTFKSFIFPWKE